ncbi:MAG TPA: hypothetical protein VLE74_03330 [Candidatus Saccharimonadales bacterium]|nr:hypothetical protein [Candidatus Saccharimonadales bacterium]
MADDDFNPPVSAEDPAATPMPSGDNPVPPTNDEPADGLGGTPPSTVPGAEPEENHEEALPGAVETPEPTEPTVPAPDTHEDNSPLATPGE